MPLGTPNPNYSGAYCLAIQDKLMAGCADQTNIRSKSGMVSALMMPVNRGKVEMSILGNGKYAPQMLTYYPRLTPASATSTVDYCTVAADPIARSVTLEPNLVTSVKRTYTVNQMRQLCEPDNLFMQNNIMSMMDAAVVDVNRKILAALAAIPTFRRGGLAAPHTYDLLSAGLAPQLHSVTLANFKRDMSDIGCGDTPIVIGRGEFLTASTMIGIGCCNTNQGIDMSQVNGQYIWFDDHDTNTILGANQLIAMVPGAIQLVTWNENVGEYEEIFDGTEFTTIIDPVTGLRFDLSIKKDDCTRTYTVQIYLRYFVFTLPADYYLPTDPLFQTRGFLRITTVP